MGNYHHTIRRRRVAIFLICYLIPLAFIVACNTEEPYTPPPPVNLNPLPADEMNLVFQSPEYGIHLAQWWDMYALQQDLTRANEMGFGWVKQHFSWRDIEPAEKGTYDWWRPDQIVEASTNYNTKLLVRIDRAPLWALLAYDEQGIKITENQPPAEAQDFFDFCGAIAERYKGKVHAWQVWNEPNLSREWGDLTPDPVAYVALLEGCYSAIKTADPDAIVVSAGLAPTGTLPPDAMPDDQFLREMYAAGGANFFDVLGLNAPGFKASPEVSPDEAENNPALDIGNNRRFVFRHVEDMRQIMVENGDEATQIAILEMGWTTDTRPETGYEWHAVTQEQQAEYLVAAYTYAEENWSPWIGLMTTIYYSDVAWTEDNEQYWWALTDPDGTPRPAYYALQAMRKTDRK
ncbi:MAG: GH35 family endo-1,4-beta-xylanase [Cellvibrionaceae bacterium]|jgi:GH35 family endo-1,4-beta-xylanase